jgi:hypothetical protein
MRTPESWLLMPNRYDWIALVALALLLVAAQLLVGL